MSLATASTTAGTAVASSVFGSTIMELGVASLGAAAMIHAGATVFDHMPHGSFFHATGGSVNMAMKERLRLIPYETLIGLCPGYRLDIGVRHIRLVPLTRDGNGEQ